jgi:hypothetical protein
MGWGVLADAQALQDREGKGHHAYVMLLARSRMQDRTTLPESMSSTSIMDQLAPSDVSHDNYVQIEGSKTHVWNTHLITLPLGVETNWSSGTSRTAVMSAIECIRYHDADSGPRAAGCLPSKHPVCKRYLQSLRIDVLLAHHRFSKGRIFYSCHRLIINDP